MEDGFVATTAGLWITWVKKKGILDAAAWKGDKLLVSDGLGTVHVPALRCRSCGILIMDLYAAD